MNLRHKSVREIVKKDGLLDTKVKQKEKQKRITISKDKTRKEEREAKPIVK
jgi:hypothetical protein